MAELPSWLRAEVEGVGEPKLCGCVDDHRSDVEHVVGAPAPEEIHMVRHRLRRKSVEAQQ